MNSIECLYFVRQAFAFVRREFEIVRQAFAFVGHTFEFLRQEYSQANL